MRLNPRIHLRRINSRMPKESTHLVEIAVLRVHFHRHTMAEVMRLQLRVAHEASLHLLSRQIFFRSPEVERLPGISKAPVVGPLITRRERVRTLLGSKDQSLDTADYLCPQAR